MWQTQAPVEASFPKGLRRRRRVVSGGKASKFATLRWAYSKRARARRSRFWPISPIAPTTTGRMLPRPSAHGQGMQPDGSLSPPRARKSEGKRAVDLAAALSKQRHPHSRASGARRNTELCGRYHSELCPIWPFRTLCPLWMRIDPAAVFATLCPLIPDSVSNHSGLSVHPYRSQSPTKDHLKIR